MLSTPDQALVRHDSALPGLALLLDPDAFADALRADLPSLDAAEAVYLRYKPGENAIVAYRLASGGATAWAYAKAHTPEATAKLEKAQERTAAETALGPGRIVWPQEAIVVSLFPNDSKLKALRRLGDRDARQRLIGKLLPGRPDLLEETPEMLRYKPERRYVARLGNVAIKLHAPAGFAGAVRGRVAAPSVGDFETPRIVGRSARHRALAYAWVDGRVLDSAIRDDAVDPREVAAVGAALAALHAQPIDPSWAPSDPVAPVRAASGAVGAATPALAHRAEALAVRLSVRLAVPKRPVLLHGDFYAKQVILSPGAPTVLDLDRLGVGDPAADLGMFLAHLERDRLRSGLPLSRIEAVRAALLEGYASGAERPADAVLALHTASALLQLAPHPFRFREPDSAERTAALLTAAEQHLDAASRMRFPSGGQVSVAARRQRPEVVDVEGAAADSDMPALRRALDPEMASHALRDLSVVETLALCRIEVRRHRPGRRALVAYTLDGGGAAPTVVLGKVRAKGLDHATYNLNAALWANGFGASSPSGVSVPEPLGVWPEAQMWLQREVPGETGFAPLARATGPEVARRTAHALTRLHRYGPSPLRRHTLADEMALLRNVLGRVALLRPPLAVRLRRVLTACGRLAASLPVGRLVPLHRDFYPDNVLFARGRVTLLDLDLYALGDPALDAGNYIAHLMEYGLRTKGNPWALGGAIRAFRDAFVARSGPHVRMAVRTYTALSLARHLYISTRIADRQGITPALLDLCERRLLGPPVSRTLHMV